MDKRRIVEIVRAVERKFGKGAIFTIGSKEGVEIQRTPTGTDLDGAIGGGIPRGRLIELFGLNSSGKTSLALHIAAGYELALFVDMEGCFDKERARMFGCRPKQLLVRRPNWGEQAFELILDFAEAGCPLVVVDSVPAMIPRKEFDERDMEKLAGIGMVAGLMSRKLPKLCYLCERTGTTVVFVNQVRDKIGGFMWGDPYTTPGGHALKHFASLRIQLARKQWLKDPKLGTWGQITKAKVVKSKVCSPFGEAELALVFDRGFVRHEDLATIRKGLRKERRRLRDEPEEGGHGEGQDGDAGGGDPG